MQAIRQVKMDFCQPMKVFWAGYQAETQVTELVLDCAAVLAKWPDAVINGYWHRPGDPEAYVAFKDQPPDAQGCVRWLLSATEMAQAGECHFGAAAIRNGQQVARTASFTMTVYPVDGTVGQPPAPTSAWEEMAAELTAITRWIDNTDECEALTNEELEELLR